MKKRRIDRVDIIYTLFNKIRNDEIKTIAR